jgi:hypothetical protein
MYGSFVADRRHWQIPSWFMLPTSIPLGLLRLLAYLTSVF